MMNRWRTAVKNFGCLLLAVLVMVPGAASADLSQLDIDSLYGNWANWVPDNGSGCIVTVAPGSTGTPSNVDYAGRRILSDAQLQAIAKNQSAYQQAATDVGIPWQMIAVIHLRESGLKRSNPSNGQGVYQFFDKHGGPYPAGPVTDAEFQRQTELAAQFIKAKAGSNYPANNNLTPTADPNTIKDTFFSYNGRADAYVQQAVKLGFTGQQGYEGSPYVMNKADARRDPDASPTTWGQIKTDGGGIEYPANSDYGAFVEYAALTGIALGSACTSDGTVDCSGPGADASLSETRRNVVCLTQHEYSQWHSGQIKAGVSGFGKYSQQANELWCADFVSWIYDQAHYPLKPDPNWRVPAVVGIQDIGQAEQSFHWHPAGSYRPKPGDIIIHLQGGESHVNIVVGVSGNTMTIVGGDQSPDARGYPDGSIVSSYTVTGFSGVDNITGYVTPD